MDESVSSKENIEQRDIFGLFLRASIFRKKKLQTLKEAIGVVKMQPMWWPTSYMITLLAEISTLLLGNGLKRKLIKN